MIILRNKLNKLRYRECKIKIDLQLQLQCKLGQRAYVFTNKGYLERKYQTKIVKALTSDKGLSSESKNKSEKILISAATNIIAPLTRMEYCTK